MVLPQGLQRMGNPPRLYPSSLQPVGQFRALHYPALLLNFSGMSSFSKAPFAVISDVSILAGHVSQLQMRLGPSTPFSAQHVDGKGLRPPGKNLRDLIIFNKALKCTGKQKKTLENKTRQPSLCARPPQRALQWISKGSRCRGACLLAPLLRRLRC